MGILNMALGLSKYLFTKNDWQEVQAFDCGGKVHQLEVSTWLKGSQDQDSALAAISKSNPSRVWLYRLEDDENNDDTVGEIVGFGALDTSEWRWTNKKDPFLPLTILLRFGVQTKFKRQPDGPEDGFYSSLILDDLIATALETQLERPILGLCVTPGNTRAINLYRRKLFTVDLTPFTDKATNVQYNRMARILNAAALKKMVDDAKKKK